MAATTTVPGSGSLLPICAYRQQRPMPNPFVPVLILVALPALYAAHRLGWWQRREGRWIGGALLVGVLLVSLPRGGVDLAHIRRFELLLAAATALVVALRRLRVSWLARASAYRGTLLALAALALVNHFNYLSFHGQRTWVHLHDVAHYYLGAKYFDELGYGGLYVAMLRAEAEAYDDHFRTIEARDLERNELVHIRELLQRSDPVKAAFTPRRWESFEADVVYLRTALGPAYAGVLRDHGFNPTPLWAWIGGALANLVPAGSARGILLLTLLDPLLLVAMFALLGRVFGREALLLAIIYFCCLFGAGFSWTGGAFLRYPWLCAVVGALCALERGRGGTAGVLLGVATMLRLFPAAFVVGPALRAAWRWRRGVAERRDVAPLVGFAVTVAILLAASIALPPGGIDDWRSFSSRITRHAQGIAPNLVGVTPLLSYRPGPDEVSRTELRTIEERHRTAHRVQLFTLLPLALVAVCLLAAGSSQAAAMALGIPLLLWSTDVAGYYTAFLILLVPLFRRSPRRLVLLFTIEALSSLLLLFEERQAMTFLYRDLLLVYLTMALWGPPLGRRLAAFARSRRPT
jgi:hypothetical protein